MKRTKLINRQLPNYTRGEEIMNMVTHIVGGALGVIALIYCSIKAIKSEIATNILGAVTYGVSMVTLYTMSSVYHGLRVGTGKKVFQVIDHCTIYFLIIGTYVPIMLTAFLPRYPHIAWTLLSLELILGILATVLTAIDLKKYNVFSMICYIFMGWCLIFFIKPTLDVLTTGGFLLILSGGIAYTIGAFLFGIGATVHWMHAVFHIFVVLGSILHFLGIYFYVL